MNYSDKLDVQKRTIICFIYLGLSLLCLPSAYTTPLEVLSSHTDTNNKIKAILLLAQLKKDLLLPKVEKLIEILKNESDERVTTDLITLLDKIRNMANEEEKKRIDSHLKKAFYKDKKELPNICKELCFLNKDVNSWSPYSQAPEFSYTAKNWEFALQSLGALFIAQSASFCNEAKELLTQITQELSQKNSTETASSCPNPPSPFIHLHTVATDVLSMAGFATDSPAVYGKPFYALLLKEILEKEPLTPLQEKELKTSLEKVQTAISEDISATPTLKEWSLGKSSIMNTYALAIMDLVHPSIEGREYLKKSFDASNPLRVSYRPEGLPDTEVGSTGRAIPTHLALYRHEENTSLKKQYRENLKNALTKFKGELPFLILHYLRNLTHIGVHGVAPFYLPSVFPYATAATEMLLQEETTKEEREELLAMRDEFQQALLSLTDKDGTFITPGKETYPSAKGYTSPLFGLAMIPLAKECLSKDMDRSVLNGILK